MADTDSDAALKEILAAGSENDTQRLLDGLRDPDNRGLAARYLGEAGCADAIPQIRLLLDAADPKARLGAVRALAVLKSVDSAERIRELAKSDPHHNVRLWSVAAVGEIGGPGAMEVLIPLLRDPDWDTRRAAAFALGKLGDSRSVDQLKRAARSESLRRRGVYRRALREIRAHG